MEYKYAIVELQTAANGTVSSLITAKDDYYEAESAYHITLASAALSGLPVHAAVMLDNQGNVIHSQAFVREVEENGE